MVPPNILEDRATLVPIPIFILDNEMHSHRHYCQSAGNQQSTLQAQWLSKYNETLIILFSALEKKPMLWNFQSPLISPLTLHGHALNFSHTMVPSLGSHMHCSVYTPGCSKHKRDFLITLSYKLLPLRSSNSDSSIHHSIQPCSAITLALYDFIGTLDGYSEVMRYVSYNL